MPTTHAIESGTIDLKKSHISFTTQGARIISEVIEPNCHIDLLHNKKMYLTLDFNIKNEVNIETHFKFNVKFKYSNGDPIQFPDNVSVYDFVKHNYESTQFAPNTYEIEIQFRKKVIFEFYWELADRIDGGKGTVSFVDTSKLSWRIA